MSDKSKINELKKAHKQGYRIYLYLVCTQSNKINIDRIANRVKEGKHAVPTDKVIERFDRSLGNLYPAIKLSYRAYLFDNSGKTIKLIAEVFENKLKII